MIRSTDVAGRIGGDEFLIFCQNVHDEKVIFNKVSFLNRQLLISAQNLMGEDMNIQLGMSVGAVFVPKDGRDFDELMEKGDKALYKVKHHGKHGCAFFGDDSAWAIDYKTILQTQLILGECTRKAGAYFVDFENMAHEEFLDVLIKNLQRGDCVTQSGRNQFFALLNDSSIEKIAAVKIKIAAVWSSKKLGGEIIFEMADLL